MFFVFKYIKIYVYMHRAMIINKELEKIGKSEGNTLIF